MKIGAENRAKVGALSGLLLLLAYFLYTNVFSDDQPAAPRTAVGSAPASVAPPVTQPQAAAVRARPAPQRGAGQEFRPKLRMTRPGQNAAPTSADPTLRTDLLAKVRAVRIEGGERNLFQFGAAPAPKTPAPTIVPKAAAPAAAENKPETPVKAPPPPIPLKFYGYTSPIRQNVRRAFFLDGEDIIVASEGDMIKKRYKVVRIGINSVVVEDVQEKQQQTLALEEQAG
jgi:hypothetical protein